MGPGGSTGSRVLVGGRTVVRPSVSMGPGELKAPPHTHTTRARTRLWWLSLPSTTYFFSYILKPGATTTENYPICGSGWKKSTISFKMRIWWCHEEKESQQLKTPMQRSWGTSLPAHLVHIYRSSWGGWPCVRKCLTVVHGTFLSLQATMHFIFYLCVRSHDRGGWNYLPRLPGEMGNGDEKWIWIFKVPSLPPCTCLVLTGTVRHCEPPVNHGAGRRSLSIQLQLEKEIHSNEMHTQEGTEVVMLHYRKCSHLPIHLTSCPLPSPASWLPHALLELNISCLQHYRQKW